MAVTLGVIVGNRDFFPDVLISETRRELVKLFADLSIEPVWLSPDETKLGANGSCPQPARWTSQEWSACMLCSWPAAVQAHSWTGTTTTAAMPINASFSTAATGPRTFCPKVRIATAPILGTTLGEENTFGALEGRTNSGPLTFGRVSTDDLSGKIRSYVGEGEFTDDPLNKFGTRAVVKVPRLRTLMHVVCQNGFEHHAAMNRSQTAGAIAGALGRYLGWEVYHHGRSNELPPLSGAVWS